MDMTATALAAPVHRVDGELAAHFNDAGKRLGSADSRPLRRFERWAYRSSFYEVAKRAMTESKNSRRTNHADVTFEGVDPLYQQPGLESKESLAGTRN